MHDLYRKDPSELSSEAVLLRSGQNHSFQTRIAVDAVGMIIFKIFYRHPGPWIRLQHPAPPGSGSDVGQMSIVLSLLVLLRVDTDDR